MRWRAASKTGNALAGFSALKMLPLSAASTEDPNVHAAAQERGRIKCGWKHGESVRIEHGLVAPIDNPNKELERERPDSDN